MTVNDQLSRAAERVKSDLRDVPMDVPVSNAHRRVPLGVGVGLISVLAVVAVVWLSPFGRGPGPAVEGSASSDVALVRNWVEGALAGRFDEIAGLTYGEFGEPEAMAELARTLHGYQSQYGEPDLTISPFQTDGGSLAFTCIDVDYGDVEVSGGIVVREWPDLGRKLWEFRNAMTGCVVEPSVTTTAPPSIDDDDIAVFQPEIETPEGEASLNLTFADGTTATASWPVELDLAADGVFLEAVAFVPTSEGPDGRVLAMYRGPFEQIAGAFGDGTLLGQYPGADGSTVEFWMWPAWEWDYLVYEFGNWVVMVYDYRELAEERMSEEERSMWARILTGQETSNGFLVVAANDPLRIGGPDSSWPPEITLSSPDGDVRLEATPCEAADEVEHWCSESGRVRISTPGAGAEFERAVRENLTITSP